MDNVPTLPGVDVYESIIQLDKKPDKQLWCNLKAPYCEGEVNHSWCGRCSYCCNCMRCLGCGGYIDFDACQDCRNYHAACCSCMQRRRQPPWVERGITAYPAVTSFDSQQWSKWRKIDPVQSMAEFYLLSYMDTGDFPKEGDVEYFNSLAILTNEGRKAREALVKKLDQPFQEYMDIAIGGELRHHSALHGILDSEDRATAWRQWPSIREQVGPRALLDAADLFLEMDSGYGGDCWATAAKTLYDRVTNKREPWLFCDRVFTLQHNNGSILNKVKWGWFTRIESSLDGATAVVGNAHHQGKLDVLFLFSSASVGQLFSDWWTMRNRLLLSAGERVVPRPSTMLTYRNEYIVDGSGLYHELRSSSHKYYPVGG